MATIHKRIGRNGQVTWQVKVRRRGQPMQTLTFTRKIDAEKWASATEGDMARGRFVDMKEAERLLLTEALDRYEKEVSALKKGHKQEKSRIALWKDCFFADKSLAYIRNNDVAKWRDERQKAGASPNTIKNDLILLSHVFTVAARDWGMTSLINPVRQVRKPKMPPGRDVRVSVKQEKTLLQAAQESGVTWLEPMIIIGIETGMRLSEILSIRRTLTNYKARTTKLLETKNGTTRIVPLSRRAIATLKTIEIVEGRDQYFDLPISTFEKYFRRARDEANQPNLHFHDLRHEATSRFFERGLDVMQVASITGHKSLQMLKRYTHLRAEDLAKHLD
jgi:integrase